MADVPLSIAAMLGGGRPSGAKLDLWKFDASRFRINHILTPDHEPLLHNHPWEFCWGLILNGGYTHEFFELGSDKQPGPTQHKTFKSGDVNFMHNNMYHRIVDLQPNTYTLFFWGPNVGKDNTLRYWKNGKAIPWSELSDDS